MNFRMDLTVIEMVLPYLIDPFFPGTPVRDFGERRREKIKKQEEKTAKIRERALERRRIVLFGPSGGINPGPDYTPVPGPYKTKKTKKTKDEPIRGPRLPRSVRGPLGPIVKGADIGLQVGAMAAQQEGRIGGGSFMDLYTPSIRRYEDTAYAGLGGRTI